MRRLLLITTAYPPPHGGGTARTAKLLKWLPRCGYEPYLLTVARVAVPPGSQSVFGAGVRFPDDPEQVCRIPCRRYRLDRPVHAGPGSSSRSAGQIIPAGRLRRMLKRLVYNVRDYPDPTVEWIRGAIEVGAAWARECGPHVIYSSSGVGVSAHFVADALRQRLNLPWVHEYRDLWPRNPWRSVQPYWWRDWRELRAERRFLMRSEQVVVMHPRVGEILAARHPARLAARIRAVPNGYDPDDFPVGTSPPATPPLRLCYTGLLYGGQRDLTGLFAALRRLFDAGELQAGEVEFLYAGLDGAAARRMAEEAGGAAFLRDLGSLSAAEAKRLQASSHVLVIVEKTEDHPLILANLPGKASEYLGAQRAILALVHSRSSVADLVRETRSGEAVQPGDISALARYVSQTLGYLRGGQIPGGLRDMKVVEQWSWPRLSCRLQQVLEEALPGVGRG